jgi:hypothetical protein
MIVRPAIFAFQLCKTLIFALFGCFILLDFKVEFLALSPLSLLGAISGHPVLRRHSVEDNLLKLGDPPKRNPAGGSGVS